MRSHRCSRSLALLFGLVGLMAPSCGDGSTQDVGPDFSNDAGTNDGGLPGVAGSGDDDGSPGTVVGGEDDNEGGNDGGNDDGANTTASPDADGGESTGPTTDGPTATDSSDGSSDAGGNTTTGIDGNEDGTDGGTTDEGTGTDGTVVVTPKTMVVYSNDTKIGYLNGVGDTTISVYDPANEILFSVNDATGFVAGRSTPYYTTTDCSGQPYATAPASTEQTCGLLTNRSRRWVYSLNNDYVGVTKATQLYEEGSTFWATYKSVASVTAPCLSVPSNTAALCFATLIPTTVIPTAFPLPIEIREE
jgi:hypothetical protein